MVESNSRRDVPSPHVPGLRTTLSLLAQHLAREADASTLGERDVLIDIELDGVRCLVLRSPDSPRPPSRPHSERLSPRECEIARMVAEGYPNKTIAAVLDISSWTVNTYLRRIFVKLGVTSRAAMVAKIARQL